jgi:putative ABC transport system permease protein
MQQDLEAELEFHREMAERGGNPLPVGRIREEFYDLWRFVFIEDLVRDAIIGARMLSRTPLFTVFAALILAIGIGANVTVFSLVSSILTRPVTVPEGDRLVRLYSVGLSGDEYTQYQDQALSLASIAGYRRMFGNPQLLRIGGPGDPVIDIARPFYVTGNLFETIGTGVMIGRTLSPQDAYPGAEMVVVLSDEGWNRYFARDPDVLGRTLFLQGRRGGDCRGLGGDCGAGSFRIVGVTSPSVTEVFRVTPDGWSSPVQGLTGPLFFIPYEPSGDLGANFNAIGRLGPGVTLAEAQADLSRIASQLSVQSRRRVAISVRPGNELGPPPVRNEFLFASALGLAGVAIVLMIACDNIAILLLARIAARRREIGIRLALGARRIQLLRQLIAENIMLSVLAGMGALIIALLTARIVERLPLGFSLPDALTMTFNWPVLLFATAISFATAVLFGLSPALHAVNKDVAASLNPGSSSGNLRHARVRSALVITQITVCAALLITAAVLVRNQKIPAPMSPGFLPSRVLVTSVSFQGSPYDTGKSFGFYEKLLPRFENAPDIVSASAAEVSPAGDVPNRSTGSAGVLRVRGDTGNEEYLVRSNNITPQYFNTLSIPMIAGRDFARGDGPDSPAVAIVNDTLAQLFWPGESSIGRLLIAADGSSIEVVGVVHDGTSNFDGSPLPFVYRPLAQNQTSGESKLLIRTAQQDATVAKYLVQQKVGEIDPNVLAYNMHTMEEAFDLVFGSKRMAVYMAGIPGVLAFLLAVIGTYGTMALLTTQRRQEIGIRIALGAHPSTAAALMLKEGMKWTAAGLGLGVAGAIALVFGLSRWMADISQYDVPAFVCGIAVLGVTAAVACYIPAKRACRINPIDVLRQD